MKTRFSALVSKRFWLAWVALVCAALLPATAYCLSRTIGRDIEFPKGYDAGKAAAIRKFVQDERFQFLGGTVSYWAPDWGTRLSYQGATKELNEFFAEMRKLQGISGRVIFYRGRDDEGRRDSAWQLDYSHARPDQLTIYLNLNSPKIDLEKVALPEWPSESMPALAKRAVPKPVAPVVANGVEYSAPDTLMGFVVATDKQTGKELWRERIYKVKKDPLMEGDVQDVFITTLAIETGVLKVTNERGQKYRLDLATRKVTPEK